MLSLLQEFFNLPLAYERYLPHLPEATLQLTDGLQHKLRTALYDHWLMLPGSHQLLQY